MFIWNDYERNDWQNPWYCHRELSSAAQDIIAGEDISTEPVHISHKIF